MPKKLVVNKGNLDKVMRFGDTVKTVMGGKCPPDLFMSPTCLKGIDDLLTYLNLFAPETTAWPSELRRLLIEYYVLTGTYGFLSITGEVTEAAWKGFRDPDLPDPAPKDPMEEDEAEVVEWAPSPPPPDLRVPPKRRSAPKASKKTGTRGTKKPRKSL